MHSSHAEYSIRMFTQSDRPCPTLAKVLAASPEQAFKLAIRDPRNNHYDKFGLIGRDGNIHTWDYRPGTPKKRPRVNAMVLALQQAEEAQAQKHATVVVTKEELPPPQGPVIASSRELADVVMKHVLPQLSPKQPFRADDIAPLLPVQYAHSWRNSPTVRSAVLVKLKEKGVLTKFSHFEYMRAPQYVDKKLIEDSPTPPAVNGNGHAAVPEAVAIVSPPPVAVATPQPPITADEKLDAVLLMMRAIMSDDRQKKAKLDAIAERIIKLMTDADEIRADLDAVIKSEQQAPMRFGELLDNLRKVSVPAPAAPAAVTLSS